MLPNNVGALLTTEDETVELGMLGGRRVRGVVRRRVLRFGVGPQARLVAFRLRPVAVEVDGEHVTIEVPADPMVRALALLVLSIVVRRVWAASRRSRHERT